MLRAGNSHPTPILGFLALSLLVTTSTLLAPATAHAVRPAANPAARVQSSEHQQRWPMSICRRTPGSRFTTTTEGDQGNFIIEPASGHKRPLITPAVAYRHFLTMYGTQTKQQRRNTQVRFGLVSDLIQGPASNNVINYVPQTRRTPAWIISNCVNATAPTAASGGMGDGAVIFAVVDAKVPGTWGWAFRPAAHRNRNPGLISPYQAPHPSAQSTPFFSTRWWFVRRGKGGRMLIRYQSHHCYTIDHVNEFGSKGTYTVSVILSTGPRGRCPKQSATAPFAEIGPARGAGAINRLRHAPIGHRRFRPESDGI